MADRNTNEIGYDAFRRKVGRAVKLMEQALQVGIHIPPDIVDRLGRFENLPLEAFNSQLHYDVDRISEALTSTSKLRDAIALKEHVIENNLEIPNEIIEVINNINLFGDSASQAATDIDKALKQLTSITYPTTAETLRLASQQAGLSSKLQVLVFKTVITILPLIALGYAIFSYIKLGSSDSDAQLWASSLALSLGLMGALVYILFNVIGEMSSRAFNINDTYSNYLRMVLGALFGWVFYFALLQENIRSTPGDTNPDGNISPLLLLPFLAGFSTRLVLGILNQAIRATELTFGIEDRGTELLSRRRRGRNSRSGL